MSIVRYATLTLLCLSLQCHFGRTHEHDGRECALPEVPEPDFDDDVSDERAHLIRVIGKKWMSGDVLHYYFFDGILDGKLRGTASQKNLVREAFDIYTDLGIGLEFREVSRRQDAEIRIGFEEGGGSWSYMGREVLNIDVRDPTMNLGWDSLDTALHEIGHTLGFPHEHQNPNAGIVWDEDAVYTYYGGYPNYWSREKTFRNVLRKLDAAEVDGSVWDPDSIMGYTIGAGLVLSPEEYSDGISKPGGLSATDIDTIKDFYPPADIPEELSPFQIKSLDIGPGEQVSFLITPPRTRSYRIQTIGSTDSVIVLYERQGNGEYREIASDDDSGLKRNASILNVLVRGRTYSVKVRMIYTGIGRPGSILML